MATAKVTTSVTGVTLTLSAIEAQELRQLLGHVSFELEDLRAINFALDSAGFHFEYKTDHLRGDIIRKN